MGAQLEELRVLLVPLHQLVVISLLGDQVGPPSHYAQRLSSLRRSNTVVS